MIEDFLKTVVGKKIRALALLIKESSLFTMAVLFLLLITVTYIRNILDFVGRYLISFSSVVWFYYNGLNMDEKYFVLYILIFIGIQNFVLRKLFKNGFEENFENYLRNWSIPKGAEWAVVKDDETPGHVLQVTKSDSPGILKEGRIWYDYEVTFQTKIIKDNFTILVRAKDKGNAVMLQFKNNKLRPHLIVDGIFVVDDKNEQPLQIKLPENEWIKVKVKVKGEYIDAFLEGSRVSYMIPSGIITVPIDRIHGTMYTSEIDGLNRNYLQRMVLRERIEKETGTKAPPIWRPYNFIFDFDIGTIGFRESGDEKALFRKINIKRN